MSSAKRTGRSVAVRAAYGVALLIMAAFILMVAIPWLQFWAR